MCDPERVEFAHSNPSAHVISVGLGMRLVNQLTELKTNPDVSSDSCAGNEKICVKVVYILGSIDQI
jgi:hypothetical protein